MLVTLHLIQEFEGASWEDADANKNEDDQLWQDDWEDDNVNDDFTQQLRQQLERTSSADNSK